MTAPERIAKGLYWDRAWTLVRGCTPVSEGCDNCWSARETHMRQNNPNIKIQLSNAGLTESGKFNGKVRTVEANLDLPLRVKKPKVWSVWNDLFHELVPDHENVPDEFLDQVFAVILACHIWANIADHKILILTKRPQRMAKYLSAGAEILLKRWANAGDGWLLCNDPDVLFSEVVYSAVCHNWDKNGRNANGSPYKPWGYLHQLWPLPNLWLGVTAENQARADERIPILLQIPAAVRFVSLEPMLSKISLARYLKWPLCKHWNANGNPDEYGKYRWEKQALVAAGWTGIDWVICGGESGPGARPMHPDWARNLRDQCRAAGVPFFLKQMHVDGKLIKMPELDGRRWGEMPNANTRS